MIIFNRAVIASANYEKTNMQSKSPLFSGGNGGKSTQEKKKSGIPLKMLWGDNPLVTLPKLNEFKQNVGRWITEQRKNTTAIKWIPGERKTARENNGNLLDSIADQAIICGAMSSMIPGQDSSCPIQFATAVNSAVDNKSIKENVENCIGAARKYFKAKTDKDKNEATHDFIDGLENLACLTLGQQAGATVTGMLVGTDPVSQLAGSIVGGLAATKVKEQINKDS